MLLGLLMPLSGTVCALSLPLQADAVDDRWDHSSSAAVGRLLACEQYGESAPLCPMHAVFVLACLQDQMGLFWHKRQEAGAKVASCGWYWPRGRMSWE